MQAACTWRGKENDVQRSFFHSSAVRSTSFVQLFSISRDKALTMERTPAPSGSSNDSLMRREPQHSSAALETRAICLLFPATGGRRAFNPLVPITSLWLGYAPVAEILHWTHLG